MDNERPIEKLLRRYAAKRGEEAGPPIALHPANRRLLQSEVTHRAKRSRSKGSGFSWRYPLVLAGGGLALVVVYGLVLRTSWNWSKTNQTKEVDPAVLAAEQFTLPQNSLGDLAGGSSPDGSPFGAPPPAAAAPARSRSSLPGSDSEGAAVLAGQAPVQAAPDATPFGLEGDNTSLPMADLNERTAGNAAPFANSTPPLATAKVGRETTLVLNNFRMEQTGNELRVVDADGSTYSGPVQLAVATEARPSELKRDAVDKLKSLSPQNYSFRVSGTNLTLKQEVVFTGNLVPATNSSRAQNAANEFPRLDHAIVTGKAQVGGAVLEINAAPAKP